MDLETRFDRIFADKKGEMTQIFGVSKGIVDDLGRTRIAKRQRCEVWSWALGDQNQRFTRCHLMDWACVQATQSSKDEENKQDGQQTQHSCVSCVSCVSCSASRIATSHPKKWNVDHRQLKSTSWPWKRSSAISLALSKPKQCHTDNNPKDAPQCYSTFLCKLHKDAPLCMCNTSMAAWP